MACEPPKEVLNREVLNREVLNSAMSPKKHVFPDAPALYEAACNTVLELGRAAVEERGAFHIALSGGSTPKPLYEALARHKDALLNWHFWLGDERYVPHDHGDSNFRMALESLFDPAGIRKDHQYPFATQLSGEEAAQSYAQALLQTLPKDPHHALPRLDLSLMGMGNDGHTASLFPTDPAWRSYSDPVVFVEPTGVSHARLTMSLPLLNRSRNVLFLIKGKDKAEPLARVFAGSKELPTAAIQPKDGELAFFCDAAACG